jgi:hypothetical protein
MTTFLYAGISLSGLSLNWELGCYVSGTQHVLASGSGAPLNFTFELKCGVGGNPYRIQGISGGAVVFDYTDSSHVHTVGSSNRYFGFKSITDNNGQYVPAPASYYGCFDDSPAGTVGTGIRQYRAASTASGSTGAGSYKFPSNYFDTLDRSTSDMPNTNNAVTVARDGWYQVTIRSLLNNMTASLGMITLSAGVYVNTAFTESLAGNCVAFNVVGAQDFISNLAGSGMIYLHAGDVVEPGYTIDGVGTCSALTFTGDATGAGTYWSLVLVSPS